MHWIDWTIVVVFLGLVTALAVYTKQYTRSVTDFLAANRCGGRYLLCVAGGMSSLGAISIVAMFQLHYMVGFTATWWWFMFNGVYLLIAISGWVMYRYRETRVLTLAQFFEVRYSKRLRVFAGMLCWVSGILNFGIFPAVGARFFIAYTGLPAIVPGLEISTYALMMIFLLSIALLFVFLGGQVAVMVTDFIQGIFVYIVFLVILGFFFWRFEWTGLIEVLKTAPADASMLNPFQTSKAEGFTVFFFLISSFIGIYAMGAWQGSSGYGAAAKSAHERKMAGILGEWRAIVLKMVLMILPIGAYYIMHSPACSEMATTINENIQALPNVQSQSQMTVPLVLVTILPIGLVGTFCAVMLAAFISTHDTYLHSWGSIFIQDVILPFRKKPFTPKQHIWLLRLSILFVAVFIFIFSLLYRQNEYILMFQAITGAIFIGGAGAVIIGGLYWKHGSTSGAWVALVGGATLAFATLILRNTWASHIYPWMTTHCPWMMNNLKWSLEGIAHYVPGINWTVGPDKFPVDSKWMFFFSILVSVAGYLMCSLYSWLILKRPPFNTDRMLHRGKYAIKGDHSNEVVKPPMGLRAMLPSKEFTLGDKAIYYFNLTWTIIWTIIFVSGTVYNLTYEVSDDTWASFWGWYLVISVIVGTGTVVWFLIGGIKDMRDLFNTLRTAKRDDRDDGMVINHHLPDDPME